MRPGRLELPRAIRPTRPSTLLAGCSWCPLCPDLPFQRAFGGQAGRSGRFRTVWMLPICCQHRRGRTTPGSRARRLGRSFARGEQDRSREQALAVLRLPTGPPDVVRAPRTVRIAAGPDQRVLAPGTFSAKSVGPRDLPSVRRSDPSAIGPLAFVRGNLGPAVRARKRFCHGAPLRVTSRTACTPSSRCPRPPSRRRSRSI
jgi:hypothetical protein